VMVALIALLIFACDSANAYSARPIRPALVVAFPRHAVALCRQPALVARAVPPRPSSSIFRSTVRQARHTLAAIVALLLLTWGGSSAAHASPSTSFAQTTVLQQRRTLSVYDVPRPWRNGGSRRSGSRVSDNAKLLGGQRVRLDEQIRAAQVRSESEILLVTLPTIGGRDEKRFATELFNLWKVGEHSEKHKGVLILFVADGGARGRGRVEVEVSRSLNAEVGNTWTTDMLASSVLPLLRERNYAGGFARAVERIEPRLTKKGGSTTQLLELLGYGGLMAAVSVGAWHQDRKCRECDACGAVCESTPWTTTLEATDLQTGLKERSVSCHKCGAISHKQATIRKYDGRRRRSDGGWDYYYQSSDSGGGGSDGGSWRR